MVVRLHFLQLPCFYIWTPYQAFLSYAYKDGRSYPAGIFLGHSKSVKDLYFAPTMDTYFTEINHVLLASRGYEYDGFLDFLNSIVFISLNDNL
jgi:hypothetical protein